MSSLRLNLFGQPEISVDDLPVDLTSRKGTALLAYLAVTDQAQGRDILAAFLWPDHDQTRARANLRRTLWTLNKAGLEQWLAVDQQSIGWQSEQPLQVDVIRFHELFAIWRRHSHEDETACRQCQVTLNEAVTLYQGDFLEGLYVSDSAAFEEWASLQRERLRQDVLEALDELATINLNQEAYEDAEAAAWRQLEIDNLRESAYRQLMITYARNGRRNAALAQYEMLVKVLWAELGVEPDEDTRQLFEEIRAGALSGEQIGTGDQQLAPPAKPQLLVHSDQPLVAGDRKLAPSPYRGLYAFREEDAPFFFGREEFTERLVEATYEQAMVAVIGPSGSGKSSVVYAGLLARLRQQERWIMATFRPGGEPLHALAGALIPLLEPGLSETDRLVEMRKLAMALEQNDVLLADVLARILQKALTDDEPRQRLLLVIDQFEELYTVCPDPRVRHRFLDILLKAVFDQQYQPAPIFTLVLTLRADFLGQALAHRPVADAMREADVKLGPMTRAELGRAVEKPAAIQQVAFEPGLVPRILDDVGEEPGNLPLLEFALDTLWEKQEATLLTHSSYEAIGRVGGALARYADEIFADLDPDEKKVARRIFIQVVRPGEGTEDTRRITTREELGDQDWHLVQRLADARLLVTGRDPAGRETAEVVHEALIYGWGQLKAWMEEDREFRVWQERLRSALRGWEASDRDSGSLLRGVALGVAEGWLAERPDDLSEAEIEFVTTSIDFRHQRQLEWERRQVEREQDRAERERLRRLITWGLAAGLMLALVLLAIAGVQWLRADHQRQIAAEAQAQAVAERDIARAAQSRQLAAQSLTRLEDNLELALLLAIEATNIAETNEAVTSLNTAVSHDRFFAGTLLNGAGPLQAVLSPDGRLVAVMDPLFAGQEIELWDLATGKPIDSPLDGFEEEVNSLSINPDSRVLASGHSGSKVILWDIAPGSATFGQPIGDPLTAGGRSSPRNLAFSPDGRRLAAGLNDQTIILWNVDQDSPQFGQPIGQPFKGHVGHVRDLAFSPDGRLLASASLDETIILWDVDDGSPTFGQLVGEPLAGHSEPVLSLVFSPDGRTLVSGSVDDKVIFWDVASREVTGQSLEFDENIYDLAFTPDGQTLIVASGQEIILWDLVDDKQVGEPLARHTDTITSIGLGPDGRLLISAARDGRILLWDLAGVSTMGRLLQGPSEDILLVTFNDDGQQLMATSCRHSDCADLEIQEWNVEAGQLSREPEPLADYPSKVEWSSGPVAGQFDPGGEGLILSYKNNAIVRWDAATGQRLTHPLTVEDDAVEPNAGAYLLAMSADGQTLAAGGCAGVACGMKVWLWDLASETPIERILPGIEGPPHAVALSPDGRYLAISTHYRQKLIWDTVAGEMVGNLLLQDENWDESDVRRLAFSPDGSVLAAGNTAGTIRLWSTSSAQPIGGPLEGSPGAIVALAFSPDGKLLAAGGCSRIIADITDYRSCRPGWVSLWDLENDPQTVVPLPSIHDDLVWDVAFSPDGQLLASAGGDGNIILWEVIATEDELIAAACRQAGRNMTPSEWRSYFGDEPYRPTCSDLPVPRQ